VDRQARDVGVPEARGGKQRARRGAGRRRGAGGRGRHDQQQDGGRQQRDASHGAPSGSSGRVHAMHPEDARIVRGALLAVGAAALPVLLVAGLAAGRAGLAGAGFGLALAAAFFAVTIVLVSIASRISMDLVVPAILFTYVVKMVVLGVILLTLRGTTAFNRTAFA